MLILASGSPRRKEMFDRLRLSYRVVTSGADETVEEPLAPAELVKTLAARKAGAAFLLRLGMKQGCFQPASA